MGVLLIEISSALSSRSFVCSIAGMKDGIRMNWHKRYVRYNGEVKIARKVKDWDLFFIYLSSWYCRKPLPVPAVGERTPLGRTVCLLWEDGLAGDKSLASRNEGQDVMTRHNVNRTKNNTEESQTRISHAINQQNVYWIKMFSNYVWTKQELIGYQSYHTVNWDDIHLEAII